MINMDNLNGNQLKAINHLEGPCMVLAGPGSGKTRIITYRIANMVVNKNINPTSILAISFTKASSVEMKNRALALSNDSRMDKVTYGTFHSVFFRILRYFKNYNIQDILDEKTKRMGLRNILRSLNIENADDEETILQLINEISYVKNELMDKREFKSEVLNSNKFIEVYDFYEEYKKQTKKIDFDDMLIKSYELLKNNKLALGKVRGVYKYILVDEFQDINRVQFELLKLILNPSNNIFVVGDEDQSIYGFRGSRPEYLLEFEKYFFDTKKVLLDINYRSKSEIIDIANRLIQKNNNRYEKVIKSGQGTGANINYIEPKNSEEEAIYIAKDIKEKAQRDWVKYDDFAIIYRTNIQSRSLVDIFMDMEIPFVFKDSIVTVYDHWVSQDILAYLRIGINQGSSKDWVRIINKPFRYISKENLNFIKDKPDFVNSLINKCDLNSMQIKKIKNLEIDIQYMKGLSPKDAISYIRKVISYNGYISNYSKNRKINPSGFVEILNELESSSTNFKTIEEYLEHIERVKSELVKNKNNEGTDGVILMTMHSAKGLEFKNVYVIGVNEGTIPHKKSYEVWDKEKRNNQIEEERRLMYVAITRAKENICISSPVNKYGEVISKSRFIDDIKK